jgi:hypothetical protein
VALSCPVCARHVAAPFIEIRSVPVHVSLLHRTPEGARSAFRGDLRLAFCDGCAYIWNVAYDEALVEYDAEYENSLDHSPVFAEYAAGLAQRLVDRYDLRGKCVVEVGCGQADFLRRLCEAGDNRGIGYDPSYVGPDDDDRVTVHRELYSEGTVGDTKPDFICCRHVLEHVEQPLEFLSSLRRTLDADRDCAVYFEVPSGEYQMENGVVWDMIYAHHSTFTAPSLRGLFERAGFEAVATGTAFGDQYLWIEARPAMATVTARPQEVERIRNVVERFAAGYDALIRDWNQRIDGLASADRRVVLWGAGAKGVSLLNALERTTGIGRVVDVNPRKQGSYVPGSATPVVAPDALPGYGPDVVVLANPIYRDEVRSILAGLGQDADIVCV